MTEELMQRYGLVTERICELEEQEKDVFWKSCMQLALQKQTAEGQPCYSSFSVCRQMLGRHKGVYLCILYAQLLELKYYCDPAYTEFVCVCRELLVEIYLMEHQQSSADEIRDTMYWFYSDYSELIMQVLLRQIESGAVMCFGGPMMLRRKDGTDTSLCDEHVWDCGLYLGGRYVQRYIQSAERLMTGDTVTDRSVFRLLQTSSSADRNQGYILSSHQQEALNQIIDFLKRKCSE